MIQSGLSRRLRNRQLSLSQTMTILVSFDTSNCRNFQAFYLGIVENYWRNDFPNPLSYSRFIEWIPSTIWGELKLKTKAQAAQQPSRVSDALKLCFCAAKLGLIFAEVNPKFSSQECNCCGHVSKANRKKERFLCEVCGYIEDADTQASFNLLDRGLKQLGINPNQLRAVRPKVTLKESCEIQQTSSNALRVSPSR